MEKCTFLCISVFVLFLFLPVTVFTQNQLFNLPEPPTEDRFQVTDRIWPDNYGDMHVCLWEDDKLAALSINIDDNIRPEHDWWINLGDTYDWKFTWFVIVYPRICNYDYSPSGEEEFFGTAEDFQRLFNSGHDVQAHGTTAINTLPENDYEYDLVFTRNYLRDFIPGNVVTTYAYPGGVYSNGKYQIAASHFISARGTMGVPNIPNRTWYMRVNTGMFDCEMVDQMLDPGSNFWRGWMNPTKHSVGVGATELDKETQREILINKLDYIKSREDDIWIGLYRSIAMYGQERDTHTLTVTAVTGSVLSFQLTDLMMDSVFTYPLTVKVRLSNEWDDVTATQAGEEIQARVILHNNNKYALVKAKPDKGEVVLTRVHPETVETPVIEPDYNSFEYQFKGPFRDSVFVTLSCVTSGASIYYTLDGSDPDEFSETYTGPFELTNSCTVKAIGILSGLFTSQIAQAEFIIEVDTLPPAVTIVSAIGIPNQVIINFSEQVDKVSAETISHYNISNCSIVSAILNNDNRTVALTTDTLLPDQNYTITINNILDLSGNVIDSNTVYDFTYIVTNEESSLTGYWNFNEDPGVTIVNDMSGNGNTGLVYGATRTPGISGNSLWFDGTDDYIDLGMSEFGMNSSFEFTISLWFNLQGGSSGYLIERGNEYVYPFKVECLSNRNISTVIRTSGTNYLTGTTYIENNTWYHFVLTCRNGERIVYINNEIDASDSVSGDIALGSQNITTLGKGFEGYIDDVRIYNRVLTGSEVQALYEGTESVSPPVISPDGGIHLGEVEVAISTTTQDADIYYTLDGSDPTVSSILYTGSFMVTEDTTVMARAFLDGLDPSDITSAVFTVIVDDILPEIASVYALSGTQVIVEFSEDIDETTATDSANYSINNGVSITLVSLNADNRSVELVTSNLADGTYIVTVNNVEDLWGNKILPDSQGEFSYTAPPQGEGLAGYWNFDDGSGSTALDRTGNGNDGTVNGAAWTTDAHTGNALYFDGNDDVNVGNSGFDLGTTNALTISLWFKYEGTPSGYLIMRGQYAYPFQVRCFSSGRIRTVIRTSTGTHYLYNSSDIQTGVWTHFALIYEDGIRVIYINGDRDTSDNVTGPLVLNEGSGANDTVIGEGFSGCIDEVKIYNRVLTESEVQALYEGTESVSPPVINPDGGVHLGEVEVAIHTTTQDADIYYTLDGSEPTMSSILYTGSFMVTASSTVSARAYKPGSEPSSIVSSDFIIQTQVSAPLIIPGGGSFYNEVEVSMTIDTPGAGIYYTLDGSDPTVSSFLYTGSFMVTEDTTVMARAFLDGLDPSDITSAVFTVIVDDILPEISSVYALSGTGVIVEFSEDIDGMTATDSANYSINNGVGIFLVYLNADNRSVELVTSNLADGTYVVTVNNVEDLWGNKILPDSQGVFSYTAPPQEEGLAGYWDFDDGDGSTALDRTGNGNDGTVNGSVWTADAHTGNALYFDGNDDVNVGNSGFDLGTTNAMTISLWFKYEGTPSGYLIKRGLYVYPFQVRCFSSGRISTVVRTSSGTHYLYNSSNIQTGVWTHFTLTYEDGIRSIYINGELDTSNNVTGPLVLNEGSRANDTVIGENFTGCIDEVKIYNRALTAGEISLLYNP